MWRDAQIFCPGVTRIECHVIRRFEDRSQIDSYRREQMQDALLQGSQRPANNPQGQHSARLPEA